MSHLVVIEPHGLRFEAAEGVPLIRSACESGVVLPSSCRNGTCRACLCQLVSGRVRYLVEWPGLSAEEKRAGCILPCVATPLSALTLEASGARPAGPSDPPAHPAV